RGSDVDVGGGIDRDFGVAAVICGQKNGDAVDRVGCERSLDVERAAGDDVSSRQHMRDPLNDEAVAVPAGVQGHVLIALDLEVVMVAAAARRHIQVCIGVLDRIGAGGGVFDLQFRI